jgi:hypothetical protein
LFYRATISARVSTLLSQHPLQEESLLVLGMKPSLQKKFDPKKPFLGCVQRLGDPVLRPFLQVFFIASFTSTQSKQLLDSHFSHVNDYHNWITDDAQTVHVNRMLSNLDHKYSC